MPVYVFDEREMEGRTRHGFRKTGPHRLKFIIESITDLRANLRDRGSDLIVRRGKAEDEIIAIVEQVGASWVFCNRERTQEEVRVQDALEEHLWTMGQELRYSRGKMLYHTQDLPFPVRHTPDVFTSFRKEIERIVPVREPFPTPQRMPEVAAEVERGDIPTLDHYGYGDYETDSRAVLTFKGGETAGLEQLDYYLWQTDLVKTYKETRNGMVGGDYSSKFSCWLAQGNLSPKHIYHELKRYEAERGSNKSTYWLYFELLWRDFFRLMGKKHGNAIFKVGGPRGQVDRSLRNDRRLLEKWIEGETGMPLVDANMRELALTGFMSNRGRQNAASYLVKDLKVNWQMGAEYFESMLIDYDTMSNYGNWNYVAGVGSDPRENRYFNITKQAKRYDPEGEFVKLWLPVLRPLPAERVHTPWRMNESEQHEYGVVIGKDYPEPLTEQYARR